MSKPQKVVAIKEDHSRTPAKDEYKSRFILGVGSQRIAFDFTTRVTDLPPGTGDQPARVLPMKRKKRERPN